MEKKEIFNEKQEETHKRHLSDEELAAASGGFQLSGTINCAAKLSAASCTQSPQCQWDARAQRCFNPRQ